jgi:4-diphosphocytidyl-2-C-methyl-D-erythritol kinase
MASVAVRAFAKINLSLVVKGQDREGFHELQTIFQAISLFDRVRCAIRQGPFEIRCSMPGVPVDRSNLVWRAAEQLWSVADRPGKLRDTVVTLEKKIPMQAGLGGGSSDAAATLLALRRLWKLPVSDLDLYSIAAKLGSDVPFFLFGGTALGQRRGDEIYPLVDLPQMWVVLAIPPLGVRTKDAYEWLDQMRAEKGVRPLFSHVAVSATHQKKGQTPFLPAWLDPASLVNDLEPPVIARHPIIGEVKERLVRSGAFMAAMSGSGSTVFGLFGSGAAAHKAAKALRRPDIETRCVQFLSRRSR